MVRLCLRCGHEIKEGRPGSSIGTCEACYRILSERLDKDLQTYVIPIKTSKSIQTRVI